MPDLSWHIPTIPKYRIRDATAELNVVYLQRMTDIEHQQVEDALKSTDTDAVQELDIGETPEPRPLRSKKWIRDYFPSSAAILKIAKAAYEMERGSSVSIASLVFVDSGWDLGNVIAAHWEKQEEDGQPTLSAARVSMGVANVLLTACDRTKGMTLAHALGHAKFQQCKVDFYQDLDNSGKVDMGKPTAHDWPKHLPTDMKLGEARPVIISLRHLEAETIETLKEEIKEGFESKVPEIEVYNWEGPEPADRLILRDLYYHMRRRTEEPHEDWCAWFVDYLLREPDGKPQVVAVSKGDDSGIKLVPVSTSEFSIAWGKATEAKCLYEDGDLSKQPHRELVYHFNDLKFDAMMAPCPIFFLQDFSQEEERYLHASIGDQDDVCPFVWLGYHFDDGKKHTLEDLRDLFEASDPFSPSFDQKKAGPYRLTSYPHNFVAIDEKALDDSEPKVWMGTTLDFYAEDVSDQLGWKTGSVDPGMAAITFCGLDVANQAPEESYDWDTVEKLWLSDVSAYREEWEAEEEEERREEEAAEREEAEANQKKRKREGEHGDEEEQDEDG